MRLKFSNPYNSFAKIYARDEIKTLSFFTEYDPTLATVPICEIEAEVIEGAADTDQFDRSYVDLFDDRNVVESLQQIAGYYIVVKAARKGKGVIYIKAKSALCLLDNVVLDDVYYDSNQSVDTIVKRLFDAATEESYDPEEDEYYHEYPPYRISLNSSRPVTGYFPKQTARERLQYLMQDYGLYARQFGTFYAQYGLFFTECIDNNLNYDNYTGPFIRFEKIYNRPTVRKVQPAGIYTYTIHSLYQSGKIEGEDWESRQIGWTDGLDSHPIYVSFKKTVHSETNPNGQNGMPEISVNNNTILRSNDTADRMKRAYFRGYEVELDALIDDGTYLFPGSKVRFYVDGTTVCSGVIKSARLTFGTLIRARLVISSDLVPVSMNHLTIKYVYRNGNQQRALGQRNYYLPTGSGYSYVNPIFDLGIVGRVERFTPVSSTISGTLSADATVTAYYTRADDPS